MKETSWVMKEEHHAATARKGKNDGEGGQEKKSAYVVARI